MSCTSRDGLCASRALRVSEIPLYNCMEIKNISMSLFLLSPGTYYTNYQQSNGVKSLITFITVLDMLTLTTRTSISNCLQPGLRHLIAWPDKPWIKCTKLLRMEKYRLIRRMSFTMMQIPRVGFFVFFIQLYRTVINDDLAFLTKIYYGISGN